MSPTPPHAPGAPPALPPLPARFPARLDVMGVTIVIFTIAVIFSLPALRGSGRSLDTWGNLVRVLGQFFPPDLSVLRPTLEALVETFRMAVLATAAAIAIAVPLGAAGARNLAPRWVVFSVRMLLNGIRTLPSLIWALLAVAVVGANPQAGVIALTLYSLGYLGKFFADAFESVDAEVARGLRLIGASPLQAFQHGLWPHARPLIWSHGLWMLEYNLRSASVIGYVGAGGIGAQLYAYQEFYRWDRFCTVLLVILFFVILLDLLGERIRERVTRRLRPLTD